MSVVSLPIIHPRPDVRVQVDEVTVSRWLDAGLSLKWEYHPEGPRFRGPEGATQRVADVIIGAPAEFVDGNVFNLTRANLRPVQPRSRWQVAAAQTME